jgi:hypothetical protein
MAFGLWLRRLPRFQIAGLAPLFLGAPFAFSLAYHLASQVALPDNGAGTPGWYLHVVCAPLALALALGWSRSRLFAALSGYAVAFHLVCWATQLSFFSGCAYKPARHEWLHLDPGSCVIDPAHLSALGEPLLGTASLASAVIAGVAAWAFARRLQTPLAFTGPETKISQREIA